MQVPGTPGCSCGTHLLQQPALLLRPLPLPGTTSTLSFKSEQGHTRSKISKMVLNLSWVNTTDAKPFKPTLHIAFFRIGPLGLRVVNALIPNVFIYYGLVSVKNKSHVTLYCIFGYTLGICLSTEGGLYLFKGRGYHSNVYPNC